MNDKADTAEKGAESPGGDLPSEAAEAVGGIEHAKPASEENLVKVAREMNAYERSTVTWMKVSAVIYAVTALFIGFQWYEMHGGSEDTHKLAEASVQQMGATAALAIEAKAQADRMKDFADRMKDQADRTKILADQATRSADAAQRTVNDNESYSYRELRPYLYISTMEFSGDVFKGEPIKGRASIVNSGRLPALDVFGCANITLRPNGNPMTDDYPCPAPNDPDKSVGTEKSRFPLGPGVTGPRYRKPRDHYDSRTSNAQRAISCYAAKFL